MENYIARKLSYDKTVHEYVARKHRKKSIMKIMFYVNCTVSSFVGMYNGMYNYKYNDVIF